jgi:hypothetical protein
MGWNQNKHLTKNKVSMKTIFIIISALAAFVFIDLEKRILIDDRIEILVPRDFKEMSKELISIKYPGNNRPKLILRDAAGTTNIAFNLLENRAESTMIETYQDLFTAAYKNKFSSATWISEDVTRINGRKVGFIKLITDGLDQEIFNYLFFTDSNGKLLPGTFNCLEKDMETWQPLSEQIVNSLKVK